MFLHRVAREVFGNAERLQLPAERFEVLGDLGATVGECAEVLRLRLFAGEEHEAPHAKLLPEFELRAAREVARGFDLVLPGDGRVELGIEARERIPGVAGCAEQGEVHEHQQQDQACAHRQAGGAHT